MYSKLLLQTAAVVRSRLFHAVVISIIFTETSSATILTFDQIRDTSGNVIQTISGNGPELDYGDHVTASPMNVPGGQFTYAHEGEGYTPNVGVDFFSGSAATNNPGVSLWQGQYGDLTNVLIGNNNSSFLAVQLTADTNFAIDLYHFDLAGWPLSDYTINAIRITDGTNALYTQNNVLVEGDSSGPGHTSLDFVTPVTAQELFIYIDYSNLAGAQHDNIGIDNIRFGQTPPAIVPLPTTWLLFASGLTAMFFFRRSGYRSNSLRT